MEAITCSYPFTVDMVPCLLPHCTPIAYILLLGSAIALKKVSWKVICKKHTGIFFLPHLLATNFAAQQRSVVSKYVITFYLKLGNNLAQGKKRLKSPPTLKNSTNVRLKALGGRGSSCGGLEISTVNRQRELLCICDIIGGEGMGGSSVMHFLRQRGVRSYIDNMPKFFMCSL